METLGSVVKARREELGLGQRELCRLTAKNENTGYFGKGLNSGYYTRIENDDPSIKQEKISIDYLWALGVVLNLDPLMLFVLTRPNVPQRMLDQGERAKIFKQV